MAGKERPILFSGEMVRAILDGRKTQTRRVMKKQTDSSWNCWMMPDATVEVCKNDHEKYAPCVREYWDRCPYGKPGDRLWVKETWGWFTPNWEGIEWVPDRPYRVVNERKFGQGYVDGNLIWAADGSFAWADEDSMEEKSAWKPSIHMPRWASRITLEITNVRVERMQDGGDREFWGEEKWNQNPWVWVIEFKKVEE